MTKFGKDAPLTTSRGTVVDYLGIRNEYRKKGKVKFSMEEYIKKILEEAPYDMEGIAKMLATCHLFNIDDGAKKLSEEKAQLFHHIVVKLLYLFRRTRQHIQTAVAFLCTRVKEPDDDNYKKLARVIQNLRGKTTMTLTMEPTNSPQWLVDSLYPIHPDMKSHMGIFMTIGKGGTYTCLCKQKLNTKSSKEDKLVAIDNTMGQILLARYFSQHRGNQYRLPQYTKIIKAPYYCQRMGEHLAASAPSIWMYQIK